ncbi:fatty acid--CoA ligase family protein [Campylobacter sp. MIT 21-1685]|uniref:ANL family adenylate-forming protein n=1 Tax=unclassified Campylobacter TaxID=2593542 RepID=UPI00224B73FA|nr:MULTISPECIES: fatty acid--CoA ligase family protein [unclassified Campylobacter]MCX2683649.1 fatty acid--CoA ligase family protein [Campylobacter sp. MIT 21-1684]MCX2751951.1 fatty acid--CoA ligase family protein [Campylobacter sp. MIT 21-1682]MCX2808151.1 fatty acid--CoA ligase family protein [Campylobacter sp. MIT 21-1685]
MARFSHPFLLKLEGFDPNALCLIKQEQRFTYAELLSAVDEALQTIQILESGSVVAVYGDYDLSTIAMILALAEKKHIAVVLFAADDKSCSLIVSSYIKEGQVEYVYFQKKLYALEKIKEKHSFIVKLRTQNHSGLVLFSSASTGKPKAIVHNLDTLLQSYLDKKSKKLHILLFLMFDHIGGINTLFNTLSMCSCGVVLKNRKDIQELAFCIQEYKISLLPASPSLLNLLLLSNVKECFNLDSLRIITYGTERMPQTLLDRLKSYFPKVKFHQTFGTSEIGIAQTKSKDNAIKIEGMEYKIVNDELFIKSPIQALGYLNADNCVFDEEGYFATGDLVQSFNENGQEYLTIIGRSKELINVGGEKVVPGEIEEVILQMPEVLDCLVYGEANAITGQSVSVDLVLDSQSELCNLELKKRVRAFCKNKLAAFKIPSKVQVVKTLNISERFKKIRKSR